MWKKLLNLFGAETATPKRIRQASRLSVETLEARRLLDAGPLLLLSEFSVNPPSSPDQPFEYIELRGTPGLDLSNFYVLVLEGELSAMSGPGVADFVQDLTGYAIGKNGFLVISGFEPGFALPFETTLVGNSDLDRGGEGLENGSNTILLVYSFVPLSIGRDFDADDDGVLDFTKDIYFIDGVGYRSTGSPEDYVYAGKGLTQSSGTPDAGSRFLDDDNVFSDAAWYNGDLLGPKSSDVFYNPAQASPNLPAGAYITPGDVNSHGTGGSPAPGSGGVWQTLVARPSNVFFPEAQDETIRQDAGDLPLQIMAAVPTSRNFAPLFVFTRSEVPTDAAEAFNLPDAWELFSPR